MPYLYLISGILNISLGFYVFKKASKEKENRFFVIVAVLIGFWCIVNFFYTTYFNYPWLNLAYSIGILLVFAIFIWALYFSKKVINIIWLFIILLIAIIFSIISIVPNFVIKEYVSINNFGFNVLTGPLFTWYDFFAIALLSYSIFILLKLKSRVSGLKKNQYNYVSLGFIFPILLIIIFDFILPLFKFFHLASIDYLASFFFVATISYGITRYRFMDIRVVIRKGIIYGISLIVTLAVYTYFALIFRDMIERSWNITPVWTMLIIIGLVALGFPLLKKIIESLVNSIFKGKESIDLAVKELKSKMAYESDFTNLIKLISKEIKSYLEVSAVEIYIVNKPEKKFIIENDELNKSLNSDSNLIKYFEVNKEVLVKDEIQHLLPEKQEKQDVEMLKIAERELGKQNAKLVMPLFTEDGVFGLVFLGEKQDKQAFTVQDVRYLEQLREQVNFTIAHALLYRNTMASLKERGSL